MKQFNIGDKVFKADYARHAKVVPCPDCLGIKRVKVILGDGTEVWIECGGCDPGGYQPSTGYIKQYDYAVVLKKYTITGVKVTTATVEYDLDNFGGGSYYIGTNADTFATEDEAITYGEALRLEAESGENKRLMAKTKDHKSWAWNVTYHRRCIKDLERQLAYHHSKVEVCKKHSKEEPR